MFEIDGRWYYNAATAARRLLCTAETVRRKAEQWEIETRTVAGRRFFLRDDVERVAGGGKPTPTSRATSATKTRKAKVPA